MRKILMGEEAKKFFQNDTAILLTTMEHQKLEPNVGGWWKDGSVWIAFDTTSGELFAEEFAEEKEAIKYANGKKAKTAGGMYI